MTDAAALMPALLAASAVMAGGTTRSRARHRLRRLHGSEPPPAAGPTLPIAPPLAVAPRSGRGAGQPSRPRVLITAGALAVPVMWLTVGAPVLLPAVAAVGLLAVRHRRRSHRPAVGDGEAALFAELLAAYLAAGAGMPAALRRAGGTGPALAALSREVGNALGAGLTPDDAWALARSERALTGVGRICIRSAASGSGCSEELLRLARRMRHRHEQELERRAERAGIWLVLPLGACFLPAFVLLTVVPVVAGLLPTLP